MRAAVLSWSFYGQMVLSLAARPARVIYDSKRVIKIRINASAHQNLSHDPNDTLFDLTAVFHILILTRLISVPEIDRKMSKMAIKFMIFCPVPDVLVGRFNCNINETKQHFCNCLTIYFWQFYMNLLNSRFTVTRRFNLSRLMSG